ncbi:MAG: hypothetical protein C4298_02635 [Thermus sp.]|uniref:hypothetical protein n=1 Tax=Thermus sp. TaxID=275 RepID=UPI00332010B7
MRKILLLLLSLSLLGHAQSAIQMRIGYGEGTGLSFGAGLESNLRRNLTGRLYLDLAPASPGLAVGGDLLFKPDLGQYDPTWRGSFPYFGGGLSGLLGPQSTFGVGFSLGLEQLLDPDTGLAIEAQYVYGIANAPKTWRMLLGVNFR